MWYFVMWCSFLCHFFLYLPNISPIYSLRIPDDLASYPYRVMASLWSLCCHSSVLRFSGQWEKQKQDVQQYSWTTAGPEVPAPRAWLRVRLLTSGNAVPLWSRFLEPLPVDTQVIIIINKPLRVLLLLLLLLIIVILLLLPLPLFLITILNKSGLRHTDDVNIGSHIVSAVLNSICNMPCWGSPDGINDDHINLFFYIYIYVRIYTYIYIYIYITYSLVQVTLAH